MSTCDALREVVLKRDHHMCQLCGEREGKLHVHHIRFSLCNPGNFVTLCAGCHRKYGHLKGDPTMRKIYP